MSSTQNLGDLLARAVYLGVRDYRLQFVRASLGPVWGLVQPAIWIAVIYFIIGDRFGQPDYAIYLAVGIIAYFFITNVLVTGAALFMKYRSVMKNLSLPVWFYGARQSAFTCTQFLFQSIVIVAVMAIFDPAMLPRMLWLVPLILPLYFLIIPPILGFAVIGARFGDFQFFVAAIMRVMLFATPTFWYPEYGEEHIRTFASLYNPFAHFLEVMRFILMGREIPLEIFQNAAISHIGAVGVGALIFYMLRNRVVRWL